MFDLGLTLPFTLGLVTAINPCGFAMLPTWIGYFLTGDAADREDRPEQVLRGLLVSLVMASAFVLVFGTLGLAVTHLVTEESVARRTPWITVLIGLLLIGYGMALLTGRKIPLPIPKPRRGPGSSELWSVFGFGVSYAVVSVGCAAPIFLLQVAGSFGRDGILEGTATYLAFAAGMTAVVASLTLSLALARGGLVRHLRRLLPFMDRIATLTLVLGGAYLVVYGVYEIRLLRNPGTPSNPIVDAVTDLQTHLTNWVAQTGGARVGLALWLVILTAVVWGVAPALTGEARRAGWTITGAVWLLAEGAGHRGDLVVLPVGKLTMDWPARIANWAGAPGRGAVPLEALLTLAVAATLIILIRPAFRRR